MINYTLDDRMRLYRIERMLKVLLKDQPGGRERLSIIQQDSAVQQVHLEAMAGKKSDREADNPT